MKYLTTHNPQPITNNRQPATYKAIAIITALSILLQTLAPIRLFAMSGPAQPEFSSFEPVGTTNMVDEFTGDFAYNLPLVNIPGPNGSGYSMALGYKSNLVPEEDASWVGYGWNLSAGAITRSVYGLPDDINGGALTYTHDVSPSNISVGVTLYGGLKSEAFGVELLDASTATTFQYNNLKKACSWTSGLSLSASYGMASLSLSASNHQLSFDPRLSPMSSIPFVGTILSTAGGVFGNSGWLDISLSTFEDRSDRKFPCLSYPPKNDHGYNTDFLEYTGHSYQYEAELLGAPLPIPSGPIVGIKGFYTIQTPISSSTKNIYGFLYSHNAGDDDVMDYHTEHDKPYNLRDNFLSIPFSQPDQYLMMAQGLGGTCRLFSKKVGTFHLPSKQSTTDIDQIGTDIIGSFGMIYGLGLSYSTGNQVLSTSSWEADDTYKEYNFSDEGDEPYFFACIGDPASNMTYTGSFSNQDPLEDKGAFYDNSGVSCADITNPTNSWVPGSMSYTPSLEDDSFFKDEVNEGTELEGQRIERSTYIAYNTNREMMEVNAADIYYKRYNKRTDMGGTFIDRETDDIIKDQIGEFSVTNSSGSNYVFGLPVYVRNETEMSYGLSSDKNDNIVYKTVSGSDKKIGTLNNEPYPVSHLLTQITTPDYIDRTMNGPTNDDFGGWTKFNYTRLYGSDDKGSSSTWYLSRTPYCGLKNNRGRISDLEDNTGSLNSIEKEIYNLSSVETKTHIAVFNTSARDDGYDANSDEDVAASENTNGSHALQQLDNIQLYVKDASGAASTLIETIYFEYDYSLMPGQKNNKNSYSSGSYSNTAANSGKLTLTRVWTEYANVKNAGIAPYEFVYKYPSNTVAVTDENYTDYPSQYSSLNNYGSGLTENPSYADNIQDRWGNYCENFDIDAPYVTQNPASTFDPAAWCLKMIKLPSGGQIHVQYEQDDYAYVHDQPAMAMIGIDYTQTNELYTPGMVNEESTETRYYLDVKNSLGYSTDDQVEGLKDAIKNQFLVKYDHEENLYHKVYFRYLYNLTTTSCAKEFIDGYFVITDVEIEAVEGGLDKIYIKLGDDGADEEIEYESDEYKYPRQVCFDFCNTERVGAIDFSNEACNAGDPMGLDEDKSEVADYILAVANNMFLYGFVEANACVSIDITNDGDLDANGDTIPAYSFMRLPIPSKKGGGIRVKHLLMYDKGLENVPSLQGNEYIYKIQDDNNISYGLTNGKSSGVAANEPSIGREENSLIGFLEQYQESLSIVDKIVAGADVEQFEGPIGESLLPGPLVGYSNVIVKSLVEADNNSGYSQNQFYTYKDYPFVVYDITAPNKKQDLFTLNIICVETNIDKVWATQGFRFRVHNMNGKPKSKKLLSINGNISYSETYEYGELHSEYDGDQSAPNASQSEAIIETRQISDVLDQTTFEADVSLNVYGILFITLVPTFIYNETRLFTHVSNQIDYITSFLVKKTVNKDGIIKDYDYVIFDENSGENTLALTTGSFNGLEIDGTQNNDQYYEKNYLGKDYYSSLHGKYENEKVFISSSDDVTISKIDDGSGNASLVFTANSSDVDLCSQLDYLKPGDLINIIYVNSDGTETSEASIYNVMSSYGNTINIQENSAFTNSYPISWDKVNIENIRSGNTNQLLASIGSVNVYGTSFEETEVSVKDQVGATNWAAREQLASDLTDLINGAGTFTLSYTDITATNASGNCETIDLDVTATHTSTTYSGSYSTGPVGPIRTSGFTEESIVLSFSGSSCTIEAQEGGYFDVDENTGEIVYYEPGNTCSPIAITCIDFCPDYYPYTTIENVVDANAISLSDDWDYSSIASNIGITISSSSAENDYQLGYKGQWHPKSSYAYNTTIKEFGGTDNIRIYDAGTFDDFTLYNWTYEDAVDPEKWILTNTTNIYSPYNNALENENLLSIKSVEKYLNDYSLPFVTASNTAFDNIMFESFETATEGMSVVIGGEDGYSISDGTYSFELSSDYAHSGNKSIKLGFNGSGVLGNPKTSEFDLKPITVDDQIRENGITVRFWVKESGTTTHDITPYIKVASVPSSQQCTKVARVGEWILFEASLNDFSSFSNQTFTPSIYFSYLTLSPYYSGSITVYVDDIRMQPANSKATAYVYDINNLRPIAQFDDQNFGLYYQYNDEGKLVRKLVETERGLKTISETQYNIPLTGR
jgi:hypothetical protein